VLHARTEQSHLPFGFALGLCQRYRVGVVVTRVLGELAQRIARLSEGFGLIAQGGSRGMQDRKHLVLLVVGQFQVPQKRRRPIGVIAAEGAGSRFHWWARWPRRRSVEAPIAPSAALRVWLHGRRRTGD